MTLEDQITESIETKSKILNDVSLLREIETVGKLVIKTIRLGHKVLVAGNGGSAADAQHFAAELVGRFRKKRIGYPVIALTTDSSFLTAWGNDDTFDNIFSRQVQALGKPGDLFIGISTSGESANILKALSQAKRSKMNTIALLGKGGGKAKKLTPLSLIVPSDDTARIQEAHILFIHLICQLVETTIG